MAVRTDGTIVVGGEALVDLVPGTGDDLHGHTGGGPYNTARTIGRLGQPVVFLGRLSTDRFGSRLRRELQDDGVSLDGVVATDDPTTLALAEVDAGGAATYRFYSWGTSAPGLTRSMALGALLERVAMLHVGTLGLVFEPMASALEAVVEHVDRDALVALDPNCRPWTIKEPEAYRARLGRLLKRTDVVKVSVEDLAWLHPDLPPIDAARALLAQGAGLALVTRGPQGASVVTRTEDVLVAAPRVAVVDSIGAGDAFGGSFLAWWMERGLARGDLRRTDAVLAATAFACLVAAKTCERAGASPPWRAELDP